MIDVMPISDENFSKFENFIGIFKNNFVNKDLWLGASINNFPCGILLAGRDLDDPEVCTISKLFVPDPLRQERIASCLLETLFEKCKQKGYKEIIFNSVADKKIISELNLFLRNYNFTPLEIVANIYVFYDLDSMLSNKNVQRAISQKLSPPKGIDILPLNEVSTNFIEKVKKEVNIKYPDYYAIFSTDIAQKLKHINTFVAVANDLEIIGWLTGLDVYGLNIFYKTFYVDKKFRSLGIGYYLINYCLKNHFLKYKKIPGMFGISVKNSLAKKFSSIFFCGVKKEITHEFISKKHF